MGLVRLLRRRGPTFYALLVLGALGVSFGARLRRSPETRAEVFARFDTNAAEIVAETEVGGGPFAYVVGGLVEAIVALMYGLLKTAVALGAGVPRWVPLPVVQVCLVLAVLAVAVVGNADQIRAVVR